MTKLLNILVTGGGKGFGRLIAETLATKGHRVFATMREVEGRNVKAAAELRHWAEDAGVKLHVLELDVTQDASVKTAVTALNAFLSNTQADLMEPWGIGNLLRVTERAEGEK